MGSVTPAAANKRRKQRSQLQPKSSIGKRKIKDKKKKSSKNNTASNYKKKKKNEFETAAATTVGKSQSDVVQRPTASQQLNFFVNHYQSANRVQLSSLELDSLKETCFVEQDQGPAESITGNLDEYVKVAFGSSWKKVLCENHLQDGQIDPGNPALLVISSSALRSLELLRELRSLTNDCHAAKLFSKHMKIKEQVAILKNRVNIAGGTPSRIKKLIDIEALGLSRLAVIVLDMHTDVKGYSLFSLPQVRDEFWDLYRSFLHQPLLEGKLRLCLYGPIQSNFQAKKRNQNDD